MSTREELGALAPPLEDEPGAAGTVLRPASVDELRALVRGATGTLLPRGGGTKPALSTPPAGSAATIVETSALSGMVDYNPSEFTFSARAGTPLRELAAALAEHGQAMPFDPPLVDAGATLGGAIASGLSGPGRMRYGPLRDFLIGVAFVDGSGDLVRGGGRVVKNAAGLDMARLMAGSLGRLGILTEATFKVFPTPPAFATLRFEVDSAAAGYALMVQLSGMGMDIEALELATGPACVYLRLGGMAVALPERVARVVATCGGSLLEGEAEAEFWREAREFTWAPADFSLLRVALAPPHLVQLDALLEPLAAQRCYSAGGHVAWVALPPAFPLAELVPALQRLKGTALLLRGAAAAPILGPLNGANLLARVRKVFDPASKFLPL